MDTQQTDHNLAKKEIVFSNGNRARLVAPAAGTPAASVLKALEIEQPKALIMLAGGAGGLDEALRSRLIELFSRGIAPAAAGIDALTIDGGTEAGVMAMMGEGVAETGRNSVLLGVAPAGKVTVAGSNPAPAIALTLGRLMTYDRLFFCAEGAKITLGVPGACLGVSVRWATCPFELWEGGP